MRRSWPQIGVLLAAVLILLTGIEFGGRLLIRAKYGVPGKSYGRWRSDPELGSRMAENVYDHRWETNDHGFRGGEDVFDPKSPGALRILAYGGSTTLCWNLPTSDTWPYQLERLLRERTGEAGHQVLNAGDINWSAGHILARARQELPRLRPDILLLYTGINEVLNARLLESRGYPMQRLVESGKIGVFSKELPQSSWLARESLTYKIVHRWLLRPFARLSQRWDRNPPVEIRYVLIGSETPSVPPDPYILQNYLCVLDALFELADAHGSRVIVIRQARGQNTVALDHLTSYSREGARLAASLGITVVDGQAMVDRYDGDAMDLFYESGMHYSAAGCRLLAETIFEQGIEPVLREISPSPATMP